MSEPANLDLIWGAKAIAAALGISVRQAFHMLEGGQLPAAKQIGSRWVVSRRALQAFFEGEAA